MSLQRAFCALLGCVLLCSLPAGAQEAGYWRPSSETAKAITGDVMFSGESISINYANFPLARVRALTAAELSAAFDAENGAGSGHLYGVNIPPTKKFAHHSTLCGSDAARWVATYVNGNSLQMTVFSGDKVPVLTIDGLASANNMCATFSYVR
jgi:hypothetical protein